MKQKTIFELEKIQYESWKKPKYPEFAVERYTVGHFSSLAKAEKEMGKCVEQAKKNADKEYPDLTFGFMINDLVLDAYGLAKKRRSYLADGSFLDETLVSEIDGDGKDGRLEEFLGRPADKIRFKKGDLVEVYNGEKVWLGKVGALPHTPEKAKQFLERFQKKYPGITGLVPDQIEPDDMYYVIDEFGGHGHPLPCSVFPARLKIGRKLREELNKVQPL